MPGTPIGKIDCNITAVGFNGNQEYFKNLFDFFELQVAAGWATRIALQFGNGGTGTDYWDGANPFGDNAFFVYRMNGSGSGNVDSDRDGSTMSDYDYYVLVQFSDSIFGNPPGDPGKIDNGTSDGVGIAVAVREDNGNPWAGTTNNDGTDSKGTPVWTGGASTVHVFPLANEDPNGTTVTNKENTCRLEDVFSARRLTMIADADSFVICSGTSSAYKVNYFGVYYPLEGLEPEIPLVCLQDQATTQWPQVAWGNLNAGGSTEGGILGTYLSDLMAPVWVGLYMAGITDAAVQPNGQLTPSELDAVEIRVGVASDLTISTHVGYVGNLNPDIMLIVRDVASSPDTNAARTVVYLGSTTAGDYNHRIPWDGATTPETTASRAGVTF